MMLFHNESELRESTRAWEWDLIQTKRIFFPPIFSLLTVHNSPLTTLKVDGLAIHGLGRFH